MKELNMCKNCGGEMYPGRRVFVEPDNTCPECGRDLRDILYNKRPYKSMVEQTVRELVKPEALK